MKCSIEWHGPWLQAQGKPSSLEIYPYCIHYTETLYFQKMLYELKTVDLTRAAVAHLQETNSSTPSKVSASFTSSNEFLQHAFTFSAVKGFRRPAATHIDLVNFLYSNNPHVSTT